MLTRVCGDERETAVRDLAIWFMVVVIVSGLWCCGARDDGPCVCVCTGVCVYTGAMCVCE